MPSIRLPAFAAVVLMLGACATAPVETPPAPAAAKPPEAVASRPSPPPPPQRPKATPPAPKEAEPAPPAAEDLALEALRKGVSSYDDGDYREAARHFTTALEQGLARPGDQAVARKHLAFIACVNRRTSECRLQFRRAFEADAAFDLTPAEAGHPTWGPVFRSVKSEVAKKQKRPAAPKAKRNAKQ